VRYSFIHSVYRALTFELTSFLSSLCCIRIIEEYSVHTLQIQNSDTFFCCNVYMCIFYNRIRFMVMQLCVLSRYVCMLRRSFTIRFTHTQETLEGSKFCRSKGKMCNVITVYGLVKERDKV
jgi:hypothetical protein